MNSRLPSVQPAPAWHAELHLAFARAGGRTVLRDNRHCGPLRVQKALYPEGEGVCQAVVLHPPSGIAGGDHLLISATVGAGAHAQLTTPGAGKWYRSGGAEASQRIELAVEEEEEEVAPEDEVRSRLMWLPIEEMEFSVRTFNCLKKENINTVGELLQRTEDELLAIRNFGKRSLEEVIAKLAQFDLMLRQPTGTDREQPENKDG